MASTLQKQKKSLDDDEYDEGKKNKVNKNKEETTRAHQCTSARKKNSTQVFFCSNIHSNETNL
jgi:hypothetical protein